MTVLHGCATGHQGSCRCPKLPPGVTVHRFVPPPPDADQRPLVTEQPAPAPVVVRGPAGQPPPPPPPGFRYPPGGILFVPLELGHELGHELDTRLAVTYARSVV